MLQVLNKYFLISCQLLMIVVFPNIVNGQEKVDKMTNPDTTFGAGRLDSLLRLNIQETIGNHFQLSLRNRTQASMDVVNKQPYVSIQQMLKGQIPGIYSMESSGEPGTEQYLFVRGLSSPLFSKQDIYSVQPTIFLNGIPLIQENPFAYDIQRYDYNRIGPATNLGAIFNADNIEKIEVLKDPAALAKLGPLGANGAIWITTKNAHSGEKQLSINTYFGMAQKPSVTPINARWENDFRKPFYDKYGTPDDQTNYPVYLRDSTDLNYYGAANWTNLYFKNRPVWGVDMSLSGGSERANFRFDVNNAKSNGIADGTSMDRYGISFYINMAPVKWLTVSSMVNANRLDRTRNKSIRDRLAEVRYLPDLSSPIAPSQAAYSEYLNAYSGAVDDNKTNSIQGHFVVGADLGRLKLNSKISFDYNEGIRDVFYPKPLLENNNFVSTYFGYNQRFMISNYANYDLDLGRKNQLKLELGQNYRGDTYKYDYVYGYNSPNDYIKIKEVTVNSDGTLSNVFNMFAFPYTDKEVINTASFYGKIDYVYNNFLYLSAVLRNDGASNMQPDNRWLLTPVFSAEWNIKEHLLPSGSALSTLGLRASWGRFGKQFLDDRYGVGPIYKVDMGWSAEPTIGSYNGSSGLSRPYSSGWVGYGIQWPYSDKTNIGLDIAIWRDRLKLSVDIYSNTDKHQLAPVPLPAEYGYSVEQKNGMSVNNKGIEAVLLAQVIRQHNGLNWTFNLNMNYNKNRLVALPDGLSSIIYNNKKIEVGKSIDSYWVLENQGIYKTIADIPVNPATGKRLAYENVELSVGDPRWKDRNGDYNIDDNDKVLKGHTQPLVSGGFGSQFKYKKIGLDFQFTYALGLQLQNQQIANRLDFINNEANPTINSVKEITFWEKVFDPSHYPMYNPWSPVVPYRIDQDLFLQNASYLKLRSLSLSYDLVGGHTSTNNYMVKRILIYVSASNLFTISPFHKNGDPELVNYAGVYSGYGMSLPRTYTIGAKVDL